MIPFAKSSKCRNMPSASTARPSPGATAAVAGPAATSTAQNKPAAMNATVALRVSSDASMPTAISAAPTSQYPR